VLDNVISFGSNVPNAHPSSAEPEFSQAPLVLAWEVTRACPLRCVHCRADAQPRRDPRELTTSEGFSLIDEAAAIGTRVMVLTGGDPLARPDIFDLLHRAKSTGMHAGFSPSVTGRLRRGALAKAVAAGAGTIHLSLDGATGITHDGVRGVTGHHARSLAAIETAAALDVRLQVATTVSRRNLSELPAIAELLAGRASTWTLFFLVATGRAQASDQLDPEAEELVLEWLATSSFPFAVRTTEAPRFRRILAEHGRPVPHGVTDGNGFCFVSHVGDVQPSGFLPLTAGNVRERPLRWWYRHDPLFVGLRDLGRRGGACGRCSALSICGGSRARSWAATGDPLGEDPSCTFSHAQSRL
jgi:MoaA/NifB/PqqE/SkfB family radical SAM enzyme